MSIGVLSGGERRYSIYRRSLQETHALQTTGKAYEKLDLSPYFTGMRQLETSSRIVCDHFATKINDINTTFTLQSH